MSETIDSLTELQQQHKTLNGCKHLMIMWVVSLELRLLTCTWPLMKTEAVIVFTIKYGWGEVLTLTATLSTWAFFFFLPQYSCSFFGGRCVWLREPHLQDGPLRRRVTTTFTAYRMSGSAFFKSRKVCEKIVFISVTRARHCFQNEGRFSAVKRRKICNFLFNF